jgi:hypothetical protein
VPVAARAEVPIVLGSDQGLTAQDI